MSRSRSAGGFGRGVALELEDVEAESPEGKQQPA